jgi:hypothetical protein
VLTNCSRSVYLRLSSINEVQDKWPEFFNMYLPLSISVILLQLLDSIDRSITQFLKLCAIIPKSSSDVGTIDIRFESGTRFTRRPISDTVLS